MADAAATPAPERKPDVDFYLLAIQLQEKLPDGWEIMKYEALDDRAKSALLTGSVVGLKTRGKNKGRRDWNKRDRSTERTYVVTMLQREAAEVHYETTTGCCKKCCGNGTAWSGWGVTTGNRYAHCTRCDGSGKAP